MPEEKKPTEQAEAVSAEKGKQPDPPTGEKKDEKGSESSTDEKLPFDQHPKWKEARTAAKKLSDLLKANELEDPDDLTELVQRGKAVKGKLADLNDLDAIIEKANKLDKYEAYWKDQEERKRRTNEDPEQTIARLTDELKKRDEFNQRKEAQKRQAEDAHRAIQSFEQEVTGLVKELEVPKEQQGFVLEFFGVGNPANDIDITDRKAIKKLITDGIKKKEAYDQAVIASYLKGKDAIPKVGSTAGATVTESKPKIMLADARKIFRETMQKATGG